MRREGDGLVAEGLCFSYGNHPVFEDLDLRFRPGTMTGVTGPSGSGKSTLLYVLGLLVRPSAGSIWVDGHRVDQCRDAERAHLRARLCGFVFQDAVLDTTRTVLDNVVETSLYRRVARSDDVSRALALLERFGVAERPHRRPGQLSGGQAQRVALCRALLSDPRILLADEPTGNLDEASGAIVVDALRAHARKGGVVVVVSHDEDMAARCDAVVRIAS